MNRICVTAIFAEGKLIKKRRIPPPAVRGTGGGVQLHSKGLPYFDINIIQNITHPSNKMFLDYPTCVHLHHSVCPT